MHFTDTPMLARLIPSIGSVGDALDNALAVTTVEIAAHIADVYGASYRRTRFPGSPAGSSMRWMAATIHASSSSRTNPITA
jgi:hypothetical protein